MTLLDDYVVIGRVVKPQGRKGEVLAQVLSDRPDRFEALERVFLPGPGGAARELRVSSTWPHKGRYVIKLEGVDSIDAAEALRGLDLLIPEEELAVLPDGSYYHHQIVGLTVENESGRALGRVVGLLETGAVPVLVVRAEGGERLIPFAEPFVRHVDTQAGCLKVREPETDDVVEAQRSA